MKRPDVAARSREPATSSELMSVPDLPLAARELLQQIPPGRCATYGDVARALGDVRAARWLGGWALQHEHSPDCPCHRLVRANGELGRYVMGDVSEKQRKLQYEGVAWTNPGRVDPDALWRDFHGSAPLQQLREQQQRWGQQVIQSPLPSSPETVSAVDVAYRADGLACVAGVLLDAHSGKVRHTFTQTAPVRFPYIPGYLTWRELPFMLTLAEEMRAAGQLGDVLFCDGNGLLHPWRAGIALCLGVLLDHPVIGISKSLLCGRVIADEVVADVGHAIRHHEELIGAAITTSESTRHDFYVSVGHQITLADAVKLTLSQTRDRRLPDPIHEADKASKRCKASQDR